MGKARSRTRNLRSNFSQNFLQLVQAKRHINRNFLVPGTNRGFLLSLHGGSPVCLRDKPSLSLGQASDEGQQKRLMYSKFTCLFRSLLVSMGNQEWPQMDQNGPHQAKMHRFGPANTKIQFRITLAIHAPLIKGWRPPKLRGSGMSWKES